LLFLLREAAKRGPSEAQGEAHRPPQTGHRTGGSAFEGRGKDEGYPTGMQKHNTEIRSATRESRVVPMLAGASMNRRGRQVKHFGRVGARRGVP
jgi:hypothetical protein